MANIRTGCAPERPGESTAHISTAAGSAVDRQTKIKMTTSCCLVHVEEEEAASCPDLTVLLQQDDCTVVNLKLTVVLQTPHLCDNTGSRDQSHTQINGYPALLRVEALTSM